MLFFKKNKALAELTKSQKGFVMVNTRNNVEVRCTLPYVKHWENKGFEVAFSGDIKLVG